MIIGKALTLQFNVEKADQNKVGVKLLLTRLEYEHGIFIGSIMLQILMNGFEVINLYSIT